MSDWRDITLGKAPIEIIDGDRGKNYPKKTDFQDFGHCLFLNAKNVTSKGFSFSKLNFINKHRDELLRKGKLKRGDVILTTRGTVGNVAYYHEKIPYEHIRINSGMVIIRPSGIDEKFNYYLFKSLEISFQIFATGSAQPQLPIRDLIEIPIFLPPLPEQRTIAGVLSSLDDKIDLLHRQNETLEALAQTLFRQWFVEEAEDDWEEKPLDEVSDYLNGLACQKYPPKNDVDKLPVLKIKELRNGISDASDWVSKKIPNKYVVQNGDVIFSWSGSLLVKIWDGGNCILNQHLFKVTSSDYPKWFYYLWTKRHLRKFVSIAESKSTTMGHIKRGDLSNSMVLIPTPQELTSMDQVVAPMIDKLITNNQQIRTLKNLRNTLLSKLMSGEVRV